jgi:hypothetical protein
VVTVATWATKLNCSMHFRWSRFKIRFSLGTALEPSGPVSISLACATPDTLLPISSACVAPARFSPDPPPPAPLLHRWPSACAALTDERAAGCRVFQCPPQPHDRKEEQTSLSTATTPLPCPHLPTDCGAPSAIIFVSLSLLGCQR